jgi:hypothetical protein
VVPTTAVAAKGAQTDLGGAQVEPEEISAVPQVGGVTKVIREGHDIASAVSF